MAPSPARFARTKGSRVMTFRSSPHSTASIGSQSRICCHASRALKPIRNQLGTDLQNPALAIVCSSWEVRNVLSQNDSQADLICVVSSSVAFEDTAYAPNGTQLTFSGSAAADALRRVVANRNRRSGNSFAYSSTVRVTLE